MSKIKLKHSSGNSMSIEAPASNPASDLSLKLPSTVGAAGQVLKNGSTAGTLEFGSNWFFEAKRATGSNSGNYDGSYAGGLTNLVPFNATNYNTGNCYNTSTYLFTVPETALYHFIASTTIDSDDSLQAWLVVNGSRNQYTDWVQEPADNVLCTTHLLYLAKDDTVGYHLYTGTHNAAIIDHSPHHTWFKGYKVH